MRAVLSSGVAMLLGATAATATESSSLRGSASQDPVTQAEEGATLDALSEVFFSLPEGSEDAGSGPLENTTESWDLSADAEIWKCSQGWYGAVEKIAPGCLGQCAKYGICASIDRVVGVWMRTHSKDKARRKACERKRAFDCLLWSSHRKMCQPLIDRAPKFGIPANVKQACRARRLDETPAQDAVAQASELTQTTEVPDEHASEDTSGLQLENMTLDAMVAATLSSSAQGCHCSTTELKQCGMRCFSKGGARIGCITGCLDALHHAHWCSTCYAKRSDCTMKKCLNKCASAPTSGKCTGCVHEFCGGDCR